MNQIIYSAVSRIYVFAHKEFVYLHMCITKCTDTGILSFMLTLGLYELVVTFY